MGTGCINKPRECALKSPGEKILTEAGKWLSRLPLCIYSVAGIYALNFSRFISFGQKKFEDTVETDLPGGALCSNILPTMNRQFVEDRIVEMDTLPFIWNVSRPRPHYILSVKMSRLKQLAFTFEFGSINPRQSFPKTEFPERIVKLDISLNELKELPPEALFPFENLAELDASFNALGTIRGIGALPSLVVLDLSYNVLTEMKSLENCPHLSILNMSHNQLATLKDIPLLSGLMRLNLSFNKLRSLEGIQNLPQLCELHVQKNCISSLLHLASSLSLNILDASGNDIGRLPIALHVLRGLQKLKQLTLKENPLARDSRYITAIKECTSVEILDGVFLQDSAQLLASPLHMWPLLQDSASCSTHVAQAKKDMKEMARMVFRTRLQQKKDNIESALQYSHSRILELQEELRDYEEKLRLEMDGCTRYIQVLPLEDFPLLDNPWEIVTSMDKYLFTKFWEKWQSGRRKPARFPYKELTKPEDVSDC
ncbi:hypothetical protein lerEdw1_000557 [Lerista edwardsae]|nr:hypothetical protein lerEdw1_000557 [Lerista edwardsae]